MGTEQRKCRHALIAGEATKLLGPAGRLQESTTTHEVESKDESWNPQHGPHDEKKGGQPPFSAANHVRQHRCDPINRPHDHGQTDDEPGNSTQPAQILHRCQPIHIARPRRSQ